MSRKKDLAKNTAILTLGKVCTQFISFFLLPLYTSVLTTEEYGIHDIIITYSSLLLPLINWQFDQGLFRYMLDYRDNYEKQRSLFSTLFVSSFFQSCLFGVIFLIITSFIKFDYSLFLFLHVVLHIFSALLMQFLRGLGKTVNYAVASFISAVSTIILNILFLVALQKGLNGLFISTIISQVITIIYLIITAKVWIFFSTKVLDLALLKEIASYSFPLIPNNLAWWVVNSSNRLIITRFLGIAANGIYAVANKFSSVFIKFYNILNLSWTETVSLHFNDKDRDQFLSETLTSIFKIFSSICFLIIAVMPFSFNFLVNEKFNDAYYQIPILLYAMLFRVLVGLYSCIYVAEKNAKKIATTSISAAIINIVVDVILIKRIHIYAASFSTLIAFLAMFIFRYFDVNKTVHMRLAKDIVIGNLLIGVLNTLSYYSHNRYFQIITLIVTLIYICVSNKDMVRSLFRVIADKFGISKSVS